ncbi:MAG: hypothetical protein ABWY29_10610 [Blastococcus sp.]
MLRPSPRPSKALPASRGSFSDENGAARAAASPHTEDQFVVLSSRLHDHMLRDHGRTGREISGLPLADLHRFEHVEQAMGLNDLGHHHPADAGTHPRVSADPEDAPITGVPGDAAGYLPHSMAWSVAV